MKGGYIHFTRPLYQKGEEQYVCDQKTLGSLSVRIDSIRASADLLPVSDAVWICDELYGLERD